MEHGSRREVYSFRELTGVTCCMAQAVSVEVVMLVLFDALVARVYSWKIYVRAVSKNLD
jgi:hypothetical protein